MTSIRSLRGSRYQSLNRAECTNGYTIDALEVVHCVGRTHLAPSGLLVENTILMGFETISSRSASSSSETPDPAYVVG